MTRRVNKEKREQAEAPTQTATKQTGSKHTIRKKKQTNKQTKKRQNADVEKKTKDQENTRTKQA